MQRALLGLALTLLVAGCAAPAAVAVDGGGDSPRRYGARGMATQLASRPVVPEIDPLVPDIEAEAERASLTLVPQPTLPRARPAVVKASRPLQCVPYARQISGITLRGDAWTWWKKADGIYVKGHTPQPGAVLVFSKTRRLRLGHLAVVVEVRNSREIVVHQANWLNGGRIHRYTPVRDVSANNDWSEVRVWYTPGRVYGSRNYQTYGFIYPNPKGTPELRQAAN